MGFWQIVEIVGLNSIIILVTLFAKEIYGRGKRDSAQNTLQEKLNTACAETKKMHTDMRSDFESLDQQIKKQRTDWEQKYDERVRYVDENYLPKSVYVPLHTALETRISAIENLKLGEQLGEIKADIRNLTKSIDAFNLQLLTAIMGKRS